MSLADNVTQAINDFDTIQNAIIAKGVDVPSGTPTSEYGGKISQIEGGGTPDENWARPVDRLPVPTVNQNEVYMLYGVTERGINDCSINAFVIGGEYIIDWGDGNIATSPSSTQVEHIYDYSTISTTPDSRGFKEVWIKISPSEEGKKLTIIFFNTRPSWRGIASSTNIFSPNILEVYANMPYAQSSKAFWFEAGTTANQNPLAALEYVRYVGPQTTSENIFSGSYSLKKIDGLENITPGYGFLRSCSSFNQELPYDESVLIGPYFMQNCYSYSRPINNVLLIKGPITSIGITSIASNLRSYAGTLTIDPSLATGSDGNISLTAPSLLSGLRFNNMGNKIKTVNISYARLDRESLVELFDDLADRTGIATGQVVITGNFGASSLTADDRLIATSKNWNIAG